ncbi:hypothetical protein Nmel_017262, partial [Mimus melanotis]
MAARTDPPRKARPLAETLTERPAPALPAALGPFPVPSPVPVPLSRPAPPGRAGTGRDAPRAVPTRRHGNLSPRRPRRGDVMHPSSPATNRMSCILPLANGGEEAGPGAAAAAAPALPATGGTRG